MKVVAIVVAVVCIVLAIGYYTGAVQFGTTHPGPHHSHAIVAAVVAVAALLWLRFQSGASAPRRR